MLRQTEKRWTIRDLIKLAQGAYNARMAPKVKITLPKAPWNE